MSSTPYRPATVPLPVVRRLDRPVLAGLPAQPTAASARPAVLPVPAVVPRQVGDPEVRGLRRQLSDVKQELARLRG